MKDGGNKMTFPIKSFFIIVLFVLLSTIGCSGGTSESGFPEGCTAESYEFKGNNLVLSEISSKQSLYLFHNISDKDFWLNHPLTKDPGASAGWASSLSHGKWSALTINGTTAKTENFELTCSTMEQSGKTNYLDCRNVVKTCRIKNPVFNSEDSGSYWVAENKSLTNLVSDIKNRGISW